MGRGANKRRRSSLLPTNVHGRPRPIGLQPPQDFLLNGAGGLTRLGLETGYRRPVVKQLPRGTGGGSLGSVPPDSIVFLTLPPHSYPVSHFAAPCEGIYTSTGLSLTPTQAVTKVTCTPRAP